MDENGNKSVDCGSEWEIEQMKRMKMRRKLGDSDESDKSDFRMKNKNEVFGYSKKGWVL